MFASIRNIATTSLFASFSLLLSPSLNMAPSSSTHSPNVPDLLWPLSKSASIQDHTNSLLSIVVNTSPLSVAHMHSRHIRSSEDGLALIATTSSSFLLSLAFLPAVVAAQSCQSIHISNHPHRSSAVALPPPLPPPPLPPPPPTPSPSFLSTISSFSFLIDTLVALSLLVRSKR